MRLLLSTGLQRSSTPQAWSTSFRTGPTRPPPERPRLTLARAGRAGMRLGPMQTPRTAHSWQRWTPSNSVKLNVTEVFSLPFFPTRFLESSSVF